MRKTAWIAPLTGVLLVVVSLVSFAIVGEPPDVDEESAREIVAFYSDNRDAVQLGSALAALAGALAVIFGAYVCTVLRVTEGENGVLPLVAFAGMIAFGLGIAIDGTINFALADAIDELEPASAQALLALWNNDFLPTLMGMFLFLVAVGISSLRGSAIPKWIGALAIVLAILALTPLGFAAFVGGAVLIVVISVLLTIRTRAAAHTETL